MTPHPPTPPATYHGNLGFSFIVIIPYQGIEGDLELRINASVLAHRVPTCDVSSSLSQVVISLFHPFFFSHLRFPTLREWGREDPEQQSAVGQEGPVHPSLRTMALVGGILGRRHGNQVGVGFAA